MGINMTACLLTLIALGLPHYSVSNMDADKPRFYVDGVFPSGVYPIPVIDGCIPNTVQLYRDEFGSVTEIALDYAHRKPYDFQMSPRQISFLPPEAARRAEEKHIADQVRAQITRQPLPAADAHAILKNRSVRRKDDNRLRFQLTDLLAQPLKSLGCHLNFLCRVMADLR
jgi:hypothetical protein